MLQPNDTELAALLQSVKTIAVVGAKDRQGQPVDRVGRYLIEQGFDVLPVHPKRRDVWGLPTFASLAELPRPVDMVNLFRASKFCADHAREVLELEWLPSCFWMQQGIASPEARKLLEPVGITVIEDRCLMVEHSRLMGKS
ncbi:CoA-binding protein [Desulfohalovibrio reitneri]|uniref:CoA-binding protein n=1 Tax=Desulfohalovibrio reitneri TaxID=1307759 RepID=UPI0004A76B06|nr:CoA-binding protein [Desulfohalovibrio reitneri]